MQNGQGNKHRKIKQNGDRLDLGFWGVVINHKKATTNFGVDKKKSIIKPGISSVLYIYSKISA